MSIKHKATPLQLIVHCLFIDWGGILHKPNGVLREMLYMKIAIVIKLSSN